MTHLRGCSKEQVDKEQSPAFSVILLWQYRCKLTNHHVLLPTGFSKVKHVIPGPGKRDATPCSPTCLEDFWQCFTRLSNRDTCSCDWQPAAVVKQGLPAIYSCLILRGHNEKSHLYPLTSLYFSVNSSNCPQTFMNQSPPFGIDRYQYPFIPAVAFLEHCVLIENLQVYFTGSFPLNRKLSTQAYE